MAVRKIFPSRPSKSKVRVPTFNFHLKQRPYQIQPFFIAPVLPGESVNKLLWKANTVSDPIKNRLMGWWQEWHLFYIRVRDVFPDQSETLKGIFLDPQANLSALYTAADPKYFHAYGVNWLKAATSQIVENYFRADDEAPNDATIDGMWAQSVGVDNLLDSAIMTSEYAGEAEVQVNVADGTLELSVLEKSQRVYELLKAGMLTDMDYSDFLRTYGVRVPSEELQGKPKHLRTIKNWQMPVNHINEATGKATTAVYWKSDERHDKNFFVKEPGFLIGLVTFRPKVFIKNQKGSITGSMDTLMEWLPAVLRDDPSSSVMEYGATTGPLSGLGAGYMIDLRDALVYGEQFLNFALDANAANTVDLPKAVSSAMQKRYPSLADAQSFFVDGAAGGTAQFLETDGRIDINLSTFVEDSGTPPVARLSV